MHPSKRSATALVAPLLVCLSCQVFAAREERVFKVSGIPSVSVKNISGRIEVRSWKQQEVRVTAVRSSDYVEVQMEQVGDNIRVTTKGSGRSFGVFGARGSVDYTLMLPAEANLEASSISGNVSVEDLRGELQVETVSGDVDLRRLGKRLSAKSISGDVVLTNGQVDVDLNTVSGDISISEVEGRLNLGSVSGNVHIAKSKSPRFSISTTSGDVEVGAELVKGGGYRINSHSGYIALYLSKTASFELSASTFSGELQTDLPLTITTPQAGRRRGRSVRGTYGSGETTIDLQTFSGDIRIINR